MGRCLLAAAALAATLATSAAAYAGNQNVIEPKTDSGPIGAIGLPSGQSFRPELAGGVARVTLWASAAPNGGQGRVTIHHGDRPGDAIGSQDFTWDSSPITVEFDAPVHVTPGESYVVTATGAYLQFVFGYEDPYPDGEATLQTNRGWQTWTEWNGCGSGGFCLPYVVDQRVTIEIEGGDRDGDGVADDDDRCADTVLPDPSVGLLRPNRFAATPAGFVGKDGAVVATLADTGGCSALQIADELGLGLGLQWFGLSRPHLEQWIEAVG